MEDYDAEFVIRVPLRAYNKEDAEDQIKKFIERFPELRGWFENIGVRLARERFVIEGHCLTQGELRPRIATKEEVRHLMLEGHESHQVQYWANPLWKQDIQLTKDDVLLQVALGDIEHRQWGHWSKGVEPMLRRAALLLNTTIAEMTGFNPKSLRKDREAFAGEIQERLKRWGTLRNTPYQELAPEIRKEDDHWANLAMEAVSDHLEAGWPY